MSRAWAIVPVKGFARAKSRLAPALEPEARAALARDLCARALDAIGACDAIAGTLVLTDCASVASFAAARGAIVRRDAEGSPLASLIDGALASIEPRPAVVLMADLPLLEASDVRRMIDALDDAPIAIAPCRRDEGTNALALAASVAMPTCFGRWGSFAAHVERARALGHRAAIVRSDGLAVDVDHPDDLALLHASRARGRWNRNRASRVRAA